MMLKKDDGVSSSLLIGMVLLNRYDQNFQESDGIFELSYYQFSVIRVCHKGESRWQQTDYVIMQLIDSRNFRPRGYGPTATSLWHHRCEINSVTTIGSHPLELLRS